MLDTIRRTDRPVTSDLVKFVDLPIDDQQLAIVDCCRRGSHDRWSHVQFEEDFFQDEPGVGIFDQIGQRELLAVAQLPARNCPQLVAGCVQIQRDVAPAGTHAPGGAEVEPEPEVVLARIRRKIDPGLAPLAHIESRCTVEGLLVLQPSCLRVDRREPVKLVVIIARSRLEIVGAQQLPTPIIPRDVDAEGVGHQRRAGRVGRIILRFEEVIEVQRRLIRRRVTVQAERIAEQAAMRPAEEVVTERLRGCSETARTELGLLQGAFVTEVKADVPLRRNPAVIKRRCNPMSGIGVAVGRGVPQVAIQRGERDAARFRDAGIHERGAVGEDGLRIPEGIESEQAPGIGHSEQQVLVASLGRVLGPGHQTRETDRLMRLLQCHRLGIGYDLVFQTVATHQSNDVLGQLHLADDNPATFGDLCNRIGVVQLLRVVQLGPTDAQVAADDKARHQFARPLVEFVELLRLVVAFVERDGPGCAGELRSRRLILGGNWQGVRSSQQFLRAINIVEHVGSARVRQYIGLESLPRGAVNNPVQAAGVGDRIQLRSHKGHACDAAARSGGSHRQRAVRCARHAEVAEERGILVRQNHQVAFQRCRHLRIDLQRLQYPLGNPHRIIVCQEGDHAFSKRDTGEPDLRENQVVRIQWVRVLDVGKIDTAGALEVQSIAKGADFKQLIDEGV